MEELNLIPDLSEKQLAEVKLAVAKWRESGAPGIFGFVSANDLKGFEDTAVQYYKQGLITKTALIGMAAGLMYTIGLMSYRKLRKTEVKEDN